MPVFGLLPLRLPLSEIYTQFQEPDMLLIKVSILSALFCFIWSVT